MEPETTTSPPPPKSPLRHAILRGCSIIAPPLVTLLLLIWLISGIEQYVLLPLETAARSVLVWVTADIMDRPPPDAAPLNPGIPLTEGFIYQGVEYVRSPIGRRYLPEDIVGWVDANADKLPKDLQEPRSAKDYYHAYIKLRYMPRWFTVPLLMLFFFSVLYIVGRFLAAGVGRFFVMGFERLIHQLPLVSNLYGSVKQVTDFILSEREIEFTRVVAVEYPRIGVWSLGFVTSDSLPPLKSALQEELVSIFVPTSPMPMTGFTINVRKRDVIDLNLTVDQAIQFIVSCGVVAPAQLGQVIATPPKLVDDSQDTSQE
ncbi:MAG: hypothetical protein KatS3mg111_1613 [Pirellulaceae bacterium]|nr:MAG: hypothetical protein KatS3mg111_1613 [Pirellulaceae bacterium]